MADFEVLRHYLIDVGFAVNQPELRRLESGVNDMFSKMQQATSGWAKEVSIGLGAVAAAYAAVTTGTVAMMDSVSKGEMGFQLYAMRMNMNTAAAKKLKIGLEELGATQAEVFWNPELRERFKQLWQDQARMQKSLGPDYQAQMKGLRDIRFEVTRFFTEMKYLQMAVVSAVEKGLGLGEGGLLRKLKEFNEYLISHQRQIAETISKVLVPVLKQVAGAIGLALSAFIKFIGVLSGDERMRSGKVNVQTLSLAFTHMANGLIKTIHVVEVLAHVLGRLYDIIAKIVNFVADHQIKLPFSDWNIAKSSWKALDYYAMTDEQRARQSEIDQATQRNEQATKAYNAKKMVAESMNRFLPASKQIALPEAPKLEAVPESLVPKPELAEEINFTDMELAGETEPKKKTPRSKGWHEVAFNKKGQFESEEEQVVREAEEARSGKALSGGAGGSWEPVSGAGKTVEQVQAQAAREGKPIPTREEAQQQIAKGSKEELATLSPMALLTKAILSLTDAVMQLATHIAPMAQLPAAGQDLRKSVAPVVTAAASSLKSHAKDLVSSTKEVYAKVTGWTKEHVVKSVAEQAKKFQIPMEIALGVARTESGFNANATSGAGAHGVMQLMPKTAKGLGVDINDPEANIKGGLQYLQRLHKEFKDWRLALMAYNWGPGNVHKMLKGQASPPKETREYADKVFNALTMGDIHIHPTANQSPEEIAKAVMKVAEERHGRKRQRTLAHVGGGIHG